MECNINDLKEGFKGCCERDHPAGSGNRSEASGGSSQPSVCSGEVFVRSRSHRVVMTQVVQHFRTLGIDL